MTTADLATYNFAYLDEQTKRMIRRIRKEREERLASEQDKLPEAAE